MIHHFKRFSSMACVLVLAMMCCVSYAQDEAALKELEAAKKKVETLLKEAEELHAAGRAEEAEQRVKKARDLEMRIKASYALQKAGKIERNSEQEEILHGLEQGMVALRKLGRHEELEMLERVANEVREGENPERQEAHHQLEIMRSGVHALLEAGRKDTAELLELAILARELKLEGRRGEEAQAIFKRAPDRAQQAEILKYASDLWLKFGHETKAKKLAELSERIWATHQRVMKNKGHEEDRTGKRGKIIKELEERVHELERVVEKLQEELKALKKRLR